ncbi:unnamed protein product [Anisakis simplex]|uniref:Selenium-binding protein 1 (inferred by orthology to a human protein) n=1 Tax=Anisakis simplex TaxID=6269 RepID=A0A0M3JZ30_ANISI|nr:unnamed protein product [Anisakis simplex]
MIRNCEILFGPGYASPQDAFLNGPREKFLFVTCPNTDPSKPDIITTVDVDPASDTYCQIVSRVDLPYSGDEVHHSGWNACSSCFGDKTAKRSYLVVPCLLSSRVYFINTTNPKALKLHKVVEPNALLAHNVSFPHTTHCLADGNIMISTLGDAKGDAKGDFILVNGKTFDVVDTWIAKDSQHIQFNYDFWYQPHHNVMVSTEWGAPLAIRRGFQMKDVAQALITEIIISMDDKFLYLSCWLHGDIRQYDISDPHHPKLVGQVFIGGSIHDETDVIVDLEEDEELQERPKACYIKGERIEGGPQMLQLSLDGKRLYATTSLFRIWDEQFYPKTKVSGTRMIQIDVDTDRGGLTINEDFLVDFGRIEGGPFLAHEMRYPNGDCTSDIWI